MTCEGQRVLAHCHHTQLLLNAADKESRSVSSALLQHQAAMLAEIQGMKKQQDEMAELLSNMVLDHHVPTCNMPFAASTLACMHLASIKILCAQQSLPGLAMVRSSSVFALTNVTIARPMLSLASGCMA